jgi:hypothetical protein
MRPYMALAGLMVTQVAHVERLGTGTVQGVVPFASQVGFANFHSGPNLLGGRGDAALDGDFGVAASYEFFLHPQVTLGPRVAFVTGDAARTDNPTRTVDLGAFGRLFVNDGDWRAFAAAGLGATYVGLAKRTYGEHFDLHGIGYHALVGFGVEGRLSGGLGLIAGAYFEHQAAPTVEGVTTLADGEYRLTYEDVVISRPLLTVGLTF